MSEAAPSPTPRRVARTVHRTLLRRPTIQVRREESAFERACRRIVDVVVASIVLVVFSPVMLVLAAWIRLDSPGPALFRQVRMTRCRRVQNTEQSEEQRQLYMAGRPFVFSKFRTMHNDARERFPELYAYQYTDAEIETMRFKIPHDPRLTRVGRRIRHTSLDELPNFWNVLKGDLTLVGPRPEIPEMSPYYSEAERRKFSVQAGVTGPAQVSGRGDLRFRDTVALDCRYADERRLTSDLKLLARTVLAVVTRRGAF